MPLRLHLSNEYKGYHVAVGIRQQKPVIFIDEEEIENTDLIRVAAWKEDDKEASARLFTATLRYIDANPERYPDKTKD